MALPVRLPTPEARSAAGWLILRVLLAGLIAAHGWARFLAGGMVPFGEWLGTQGFPFGFYIAAAITAFEIAGTPLLLLRVWGPLLCLTYACIYALGIVMVHAPDGWFVVGLGRNGAEYSVLLIACLLCVGLQHLPSNRTGTH